MKIPLNVNHASGATVFDQQAEELERYIQAAKRGDWEAKDRIVATFTPLVRRLAERRSDDPHVRSQLIEAGKEGIAQAIRKYRTSVGGSRFQLFALNFVEQRMTRASAPGGLFARLFRRP